MKVIIPCGAAKLDRPAPAGELYTGTMFRAQLRWALSIADRACVLIFSAKHGFIPLDRVVEPYNLRLGMAGAIRRDAAAAQARDLGLGDERDVIIVGGADYALTVKAIVPHGRTVLTVMRQELIRTGMGHQIQWLTKNMGRAI